MTRWLLRLLVLAGLGFAAWKVWQLLQEGEDHSDEWAATTARAERGRAAEARAGSAPPGEETRTASAEAADATWVKPVGAECPPGYPVKAKTASKVFRVPGMFSYAESKPERCYCNEDAAAADGFTRAKR